MLAAGRGYSEVVELLLKHGADPDRRDRDGDTALKYAAWNDDVVVVEALIAGGADVNLASELNITPLRVAATSGNTTVVEALPGAAPTRTSAGATARPRCPSPSAVTTMKSSVCCGTPAR